MKTLTELSLQLQLREFSLFSFFQQTTKCRVVVFGFGGVSPPIHQATVILCLDFRKGSLKNQLLLGSVRVEMEEY